MSVSKRVRFEVFKRDLFTCQYCGSTPPSVVLEIDHVIARANGGHDSIGNLATSCFPCNRGKGAGDLKTIPRSITENAGEMMEREAQLRAYKRLLISIKNRESADIDDIEQAFKTHFPDHQFTDKFRTDIRQSFLPELAGETLVGFMHRACARLPGDERKSIKYFCGMCWGSIKQDGRNKWGYRGR